MRRTSDNHPCLSIIMPCFNVAETLDRAVQSVLMQKVNFEYEIIAVDDASSDKTLDILKAYKSEQSRFCIICHTENCGNAASFYDALSSAQGDYFCVLDGDDYYTLPDKLQKQVDFLNADTKQIYVGCCHYFVVDTGNGNVSVPDCVDFEEFNYTDYIMQRAGYFHTTTHMYRNIFRGNVPELYRQQIYRGDSPRTIFHTMYSGGKIKILPFVASVYSYTYKGIWSGMNQKRQFEYQVNFLTSLEQTVTSSTERSCVKSLQEYNAGKKKHAEDALRKYPEKSIEDCLRRAHRYAQNYAFRESEYFFQHIYSSEYIDTLCATLGVVYRNNHAKYIQKTVTPKRLMVLIWQLNPRGGGLYREIEEILKIYNGWHVEVIVTDRDSDISDVQQYWADMSCVSVMKIPQNCIDTLAFLSNEMCTFKPEKIYVYCSHVDVYSVAAIQPEAARNVCLFSYDHGFVVGLKNPFLNMIVAKRPSDYALLTNSLDSEKVIYIPTWNYIKYQGNIKYEAFRNHDKLITACGAARFYKLEGGWPYNYFDYIAALLKATGGKHYHFGYIPEEKMRELEAALDAFGVSHEQFIQIEWEDNLAQFCLEQDVDVFIEPFPVVSYKMTLDIIAVGIPVIAMDSVKRMEKTDFLYPGAMSWKSKEQFVDILAHITREELNKQSRKAAEYFKLNHSVDIIKPCLINDHSLYIPQHLTIADINILDIKDQKRLFLDCSPIKIMDEKRISITSVSSNMYEQVDALRRSKTYRAGYIALFLPRAVKLFIRKLSKCGLKEAAKLALHPDAETTHTGNPIAELEYIQNCTSMKVGRILIAPIKTIINFCLKHEENGKR